MTGRLRLFAAAVCLLGSARGDGAAAPASRDGVEFVFSARPVRELSASVADGRHGVIWTLGDGGTGAVLGRAAYSTLETSLVRVAGATNADWEALALDGRGRLWIVDAGDNRERRASIVLYELDPAEALDGDASIERAIMGSYRGGPRDVEAAVVQGERLFLIEKTFGAPARVESFDIGPRAASRQFGEPAGTIAGAADITDAAVGPDGTVFLLTYGGLFQSPGAVAGCVEARPVRSFSLGQMESLFVGPDGFYVGVESGEVFRVSAPSPAR